MRVKVAHHGVLRNRLSALLCTLLLLSTNLALSGDNKPAPDFTLPNEAGTNLSLSDLQGEVVMINFWASWCAPCRKEMPLLNALYKKYKPLGFTILGVNVDENSNDAYAMLKEIPVSFPVVFDSHGRIGKLYGLIAMPSTIFVDRNGMVRFAHAGYIDGDEKQYETYIKTLVRE